MIGRLVRSIDFERVLRTPTRAQTTHFAVHHLEGPPSPATKPAASKLSTGIDPGHAPVVDESPVPHPCGAPSCAPTSGKWLGTVVPKRHARRSVTRNLVRRQMRASVERHGDALESGLWVLRLRAPFDPAQFPSAASRALVHAARAELESVLAATLARAGKKASRVER
jgi:ribonuclease P protein component